MQNTKLYETILGLTAPWHVARVELDAAAERVDIWLALGPTRWPCPTCGESLPSFDHAAARTWRHLDTCQFRTHVHAEIPRVQCPTHGVKQVRVQQEHRAFLRAGEESPLTTKYLWLFSDERRPARHAETFATLQALPLKVGRA